ncbi:DUF916 and DUF3324 domain-containing protein [Enterococcus mundtii]|uniref:Uncharacterized protein n=1 Tax=Enterococcus mundtii TaxID=53346 RepID=A0A242KV06_ENTMU|nr:DUF916 and DUF3324 domain-containing protein [Enterococcus mundtii]OTP24878.1 hypothetical protein A5802_003033 [Enterococcus mundtii]
MSCKNVEANENISFSIQPLTSEEEPNQQGYYDFQGYPGQSEHVKIRVSNLSDKDIIVRSTVNSASTGQAGIPNYGSTDKIDDTLLYPMNMLTKLSEESINLTANESKIIEVTINYPKEDWEGQILGGLRFTKETDEKKEGTITQEIAYTIGIILEMKDGHLPQNELVLNDIGIGQRNYRNFIEANIQNTKAVIVENLEIESRVINKKGKEVYQYDVKKMRMAPNSNFDFGIPTSDVPLQPGRYTLIIHAIADEKEYDFKKEFTISADEASEFNKSAVNLEVANNHWPYIIIGSLTLVILALLGLLYKKRAN